MCCGVRLLQRRCATECLGIPHAAVTIRTTRGKKPFLADDAAHAHPQAPNFNFSVSHEVRRAAACPLSAAKMGSHHLQPTAGGCRGSLHPSRWSCRSPDTAQAPRPVID